VRAEADRSRRHGAEVERLYAVASRLLVLKPDQVGGIAALKVFRDAADPLLFVCSTPVPPNSAPRES